MFTAEAFADRPAGRYTYPGQGDTPEQALEQAKVRFAAVYMFSPDGAELLLWDDTPGSAPYAPDGSTVSQADYMAAWGLASK